MRVNSVNGGRKDEGGRESNQKKKKRQGKWGAKIRPPHLNSAKLLSQLPPKKEKKNPFYLFIFPLQKNHIMKREGSY